MRRLSKASNRWKWNSKRSGASHVSDAKFASFYEEADFDAVVDVERQPGKKSRILSSSKLVGVNQQKQKMFECIKCGKGFQSSKALCGHMACHSVKEKSLRKKTQLLTMDSQSDTESEAKSLRMGKCKTKFDDPIADSRSKLYGYSYSNCSSEASGVEQEQEEVAISLMMLSRDSGNWDGLNSVGDSSENNSVVLEARSVNTNLMNKDGLRYDVYETDGSADVSKGKGIVQHCSNNVGYYRKMVNKYECSICFKVFRSVQALGGHRRVHLALRSDINMCYGEVSAIFKGNGTRSVDFIDLNLPAPMQDEGVY